MIIYKVTCNLNGKYYIGQTQSTMEHRWAQHLHDVKIYKNNSHFHNAIRKYGAENFELQIIEEIEDINLLNEAEMKWIEYYDSMNLEKGYNLTFGGDNGFITSEETKQKISNTLKGHIVTKETRKKISETNKGRISPMKDKHHSDKSKEKIKQKRALQIFSLEHRKKMSESHKNITDETKKKISEKMKKLYENGYINPMKGKIPWNKKNRKEVS